ncbi:hypothetical protein, partial [Bifidobacterium longum]
FQSRFFVLANENRTQDAGHALLRQTRNPKVRKKSGVILEGAGHNHGVKMRAIGKTGTLVHSYGAVDSFAYQRAILRMLAHDDKTPLINMDVQLYGLLPQ